MIEERRMVISGGGRRLWLKGIWDVSEVMEIFYILMRVVAMWVFTYAKLH